MPEPTSQDRAAIARGLVSLVVTIVIMALLLFLPAGTADWPLGWWFIAAFVSYVLFVLSFAGQTWPQAVNRHFEPGVRIQEDRGQKVIDTGPYAIVRHPGYISGALLALSMPLMLASWWALLPALVAVAALAVRTPFEERTLRDGLPGYTEYTQRVKYRWVPGVW